MPNASAREAERRSPAGDAGGLGLDTEPRAARSVHRRRCALHRDIESMRNPHARREIAAFFARRVLHGRVGVGAARMDAVGARLTPVAPTVYTTYRWVVHNLRV